MQKQEQLGSRLPKTAHEVMNDLALPLMTTLGRRVTCFSYLGHLHVCTHFSILTQVHWPDVGICLKTIFLDDFTKATHSSFSVYIHSACLLHPYLPPRSLELDWTINSSWLYFLKISKVTLIWLVSLFLTPPTYTYNLSCTSSYSTQ
jgi:hypothetical protein